MTSTKWSLFLSTFLKQAGRNLWIAGCLTFLFFGLIYATVLPPFQGPDEGAHWWASLSNLSLLQGASPENCSLAKELPDFFEAGRIPFHKEEKIRVGAYGEISHLKQKDCRSLVTYGTLFAYPSTLLASLLTPSAEVSGESSLWLFYLTRYFNGLMVTLILARLLFLGLTEKRRFPLGLASLAVIVCCPLFVQQSFVVTADVAVNSMSLSLFTILLFYERLKRLDLFLFLTTGVFACISKPIIIPLIFPICLYRAYLSYSSTERSLNRKPQLVLFLKSCTRQPVLGIAVGLTFLGFYVALSQLGVEKGKGNPVGSQMANFLAHPFETLERLIRATRTAVRDRNFFMPLGWIDVVLPVNYQLRFLQFIQLVLSLEILAGLYLAVKHWGIPARDKLNHGVFLVLALSGSGLALLLPAFVMYLVQSPAAALQNYLSARYYFPFLIVLLGLLSALGIRMSPRKTSLRGPLSHVGAIRLANQITLPLFLSLGLYSIFFVIFECAKRYY